MEDICDFSYPMFSSKPVYNKLSDMNLTNSQLVTWEQYRANSPSSVTVSSEQRFKWVCR